METELKFEQIQCYDLLTKAVTTHEETTETTLPDYCATASRILDATGQLLVREKQAAEGLLRGEVLVSVLYLSEETEGLQSVTIMVPFTCEINEPKLRECHMLQVHSRLLLCEAKPITGRKLYLRVIPELTVLGYGQRILRLCSGAEGKGLQVRVKKRDLCLLAAVEERSCTTAQEFDVGSSGAEEILLSQVVPRITSCQQIGSKVVVKGEMDISALIRAADRKLQGIVQTLPFSQILDGITVPSECRLQVEAAPAEWDLRLVRSDSACRMGLTARITLQVYAYQKREICYIDDLYSICQSLKTQVENSTITQRVSPACMREWAEEQLESGRGTLFAYVTAFDCGSAIARCDNGRAELATTVRMRVLYQDENGAPVMAERSREISTVMEGCPDTVWVTSGIAELRGNAGTCQVRIPVCFCGCVGEPVELRTVTAVEECAEDKPQPRPSLVLRRPCSGECLWDIAKQHGSSEEAIKRCNHMDDDTIPEGMLLIPVLRS